MKKEKTEYWPSKKICKLLRITRSTLSNYRKAGCPGPGGKQGYDLFEFFWWYQDNIITSPMAESSYAEEKLAYAKARARLKELELRQKEGELVSIREAMDYMTAHCMMARHGFMNLPYRMAPVVTILTDGKEAFLALKEEVWGILRRFSESKKLFLKELEGLKEKKR